ncbi:hypothetical protein [Streptomyces avermitilis]|uniref:hypothetical protein n=1 Tax=Streptomyces avermitilis TaxID=33903 RepID=UPI003689CBFC
MVQSARTAGHHVLDGTGSWCSPEHDLPAHIWQGYHDAADAARQAQHEAWLASLAPAERADWEADQEAAYQADMADEAREPYDPYDDKHQELVLDALEEERWAGVGPGRGERRPVGIRARCSP